MGPKVFKFFFFCLVFLITLNATAADGKISLYTYHTGKVVDVVYKVGRSYDKRALNQINTAMASPDGRKISISLRLIELLDDIQDHFGVDTIEIISGYRNPPYNKALRKNGRAAASESPHLRGMAADIHIDEISEEALQSYASSLKAGGVGFYPAFNFIHVDVGPVRSWEEAPPRERILTGMEASPNNLWRVVTDKNQYRVGEPIRISITNTSYDKMRLTTNIWYEHFKKGEWGGHGLIEKRKKVHILKPGREINLKFLTKEISYGKNRLVVFTSEDFTVPPAYSNEFYVKKE